MHHGIDGFNDVNVYLHWWIKKNQIKYIHDCTTLKGLIWFSSCYKSGQISIVIISYNSKYEFLFKFHHKIVWKMLTTPSNHCLFIIIIVVETWNFVVEIPKGVSDFGNVIKASTFIIILPLNKYHFELPSLH